MENVAAALQAELTDLTQHFSSGSVSLHHLGKAVQSIADH